MTMSVKFVSQAYVELAEMRQRLDRAERYGPRGVAADLRCRIATSEAQIRQLEFASRR